MFEISSFISKFVTKRPESMFLGDIEAEHGKGVADITKQIPAFRVLLFACAVIFVLIFGIYGPAFPASSFIYAGF